MKKIKSFIVILVFCLPFLSSCQSSFFDIDQSTDQFTPIGLSAGNCDYGGAIKAVQAIDRYTVKFDLCAPDPVFPAKIAFPVFAIQDGSFMNFAGGNSNILSQSANGTGPYYVREYQKGEHILLSRNDSYWGVPPKTKEIRFEWVDDEVRRQSDFQYGSVDGVDRFVLSPFQTDTQSTDYDVFYRPSLNLLFLGINNTIKPFDNLEFRKSIAYAINRDQIVDSFFLAGSEVANQVATVSMRPGYTTTLDWYETNIKLASDALIASQVDYEKEIVLYYSEDKTSYNLNPDQVAEEIKNELNFLGINIRTQKMPDAEFKNMLANGEAGLFLFGVSADYPDASSFYQFLFSDESKIFGNLSPEIKLPVESASNTVNDRERQKFYDEANFYIKQQLPLIPIAHARSSLAFRKNIQNVLVGPMNENFPEMITSTPPLVFLQGNEPPILWPADETDIDAFRITSLIYDTLVQYEFGSTSLRPGLADSWEPNEDLTSWTFNLRYGVKFLNGATFDANDVVTTFTAIWDAQNPNHVGNTGEFEYFKKFFGEFLNN